MLRRPSRPAARGADVPWRSWPLSSRSRPSAPAIWPRSGSRAETTAPRELPSRSSPTRSRPRRPSSSRRRAARATRPRSRHPPACRVASRRQSDRVPGGVLRGTEQIFAVRTTSPASRYRRSGGMQASSNSSARGSTAGTSGRCSGGAAQRTARRSSRQVSRSTTKQLVNAQEEPQMQRITRSRDGRRPKNGRSESSTHRLTVLSLERPDPRPRGHAAALHRAAMPMLVAGTAAPRAAAVSSPFSAPASSSLLSPSQPEPPRARPEPPGRRRPSSARQSPAPRRSRRSPSAASGPTRFAGSAPASSSTTSPTSSRGARAARRQRQPGPGTTSGHPRHPPDSQSRTPPRRRRR